MEAKYPSELRNNIERRMAARNLKPKDLADVIGVSQASISRYINRVKFPKHVHLVALCRALQCDVGDLFHVQPPEK